MSPSTPAQAILWRCWRLTWRPFLVSQLTVFAILIPVLSLFAADMDAADFNEGMDTLIFVFIIFLWATTLPVTYRSELGWRAFGYMFGYDFVRPVSSLTLVLVPMCFLCTLFVVAYLIPAFLFYWLFDYHAPYWFVCVAIVGAVLVLNIANWWTTDTWSSVLSWVAIVVLYALGLLLPETVTDPDTGLVSLTSIETFVGPLLIYAGFVAITILGVTRQRHGENLIELSSIKLLSDRQGLGNILTLSFLKSACPNHSPLRAELWREGRFRGLTNHAFYGILGGLFVLLMAITIQSRESDGPGLVTLIVFSLSALALICLVVAWGCYGITMVQGNAREAEFARSRPLDSGALLAIRFGTALSGMLVATLSLYVTLLLLGPLLIQNFAELRTGFHDGLAGLLGTGILEATTRLAQVLLALLLVQIFFASLVTMCVVHPRLAWFAAAIPIYTLILSFGLRSAGLLSEEAAIILISHLWIPVLAVPLATICFLYDVVRSETISVRQLVLLVTGCLLLYLWYAIRYQTLSSYDPEGEGLLGLLTLNLIGLLPLFSASLALFTMNRFRHR